MKIVIYQVMTRLFGNKRADKKSVKNTQNGTLKENGVGKFSMFTPEVLKGIKKFGYTHVWFTGVLDHATQTDYSTIGQPANHPAVVKGKAGSPYAVRDYYNVDPDLADNPKNRMQEWEDLLARTHKAGLKVIMDFIPNHVARNYNCISAPKGVKTLGHGDRINWHFWPKNNFYYCVNESFNPQFDRGDYSEFPARVTGNDCFTAAPTKNDWYETVKLNYGVDYCGGGIKHFNPHPDTWHKMLQILLFWAEKGVDGFRCDMAEMVPVEFWHWAIKHVKKYFPDIIFIAEVYKPSEYRNYINQGGFDYLYDKVGLYDTLRSTLRNEGPAEAITYAWQSVDDIKEHMLNFMENHDEQRIASTYFAGDGGKGFTAMAVSTLISRSPVMVYSGQEVGEAASESEGFSGNDGKTTIFDYWRVDSLCKLQQYFDGEDHLDPKQKTLLDKYNKLLSLASTDVVAKGEFYDLMWLNQRNVCFDPLVNYAFLRYTEKEVLIVVANFSSREGIVEVNLSQHVFDTLKIPPKDKARARDIFEGKTIGISFVPDRPMSIKLEPNSVKALRLKL